MGSLALLRSHPQLVRLSLVNFLDYLAHASLPGIAVLYMMYRYQWDERVVGFTMAAVGLCAMVVQGGLIGPVVARFGARRALIIGLAFGIAGFSMFGLAPTGPMFWIGIPLLALWGIANPAALGIMSPLVGPSEQGQLQGANASLMGIANLIGPGLFTQTFAIFIAAGSSWHLPGAPFLLAALLVAGAALIARRAT
jgi:DHA1 family tetracycline resistance protein-like MFS transporter